MLQSRQTHTLQSRQTNTLESRGKAKLLARLTKGHTFVLIVIAERHCTKGLARHAGM